MTATRPDQHESTSYASMLRSMSAFGSVQVMQTVVQLAKAKCIAILLGPAGMGISSLLNSSSSVIKQLCAAGTPTAVARDTALASTNPEEISRIATATRRMSIVLGLASLALCAIAAQLLSEFSFGTSLYAWQYWIVGIAVGIGIIADNEKALLQGCRQVRKLSWATLWSSLVGLCIGVPMYWLWGNDGIAPAMAVLAACMWAFYRYNNQDLVSPQSQSWRESLRIGRPLVAFGIMMMGAQLIAAITVYGQNVFVRANGDSADVGLFQAAISITAQYTAVIFAAMAMDYFPRLTSLITDKAQWQKLLTRQTRLVALATAPLSMLLILTAPLVVRVLLSSEFSASVPLLRWLGVSIYLQALSYPAGYVTLAKGNKHLFFWMEGVGFNLAQLAAVCIGYRYWGLEGIGAAYVGVQCLSVVVYLLVNYKNYDYAYPLQLAGQSVMLLLAVLTVGALSWGHAWWAIALAWLIFAITAWTCCRRIYRLWSK